MLKIYNTMTQEKEAFTPVVPGKVRMYVCGPTVYDYLHVGNFRPHVFFNVVRNWLEKSGYEVLYVCNFTDVDDKIINRANGEGVEAHVISERYIDEFRNDFRELKIKAHSRNPRVTECMGAIIEMIGELIKKEKAYVEKGEVFYAVRSFEQYGKLSNRKPDDMMAGSRVEIDPKKKDPLDFTLWKPSKPDEPSWDSPWGKGRPGWHIECSAMAKTFLGETIDIHGGGMDLIFPHHENEIAQSEGCSGQTFVRYWMHNNMLTFGTQKMSKSLGNIRTGRDFLREYNGEILKYLLLQVHYRSTCDFSEEQVGNAISAVARVYSAMALADEYGQAKVAELSLEEANADFAALLKRMDEEVAQSLDDDFNTPEVFARVFEVVRNFNTLVKRGMHIKPAVKSVCQAFLKWMRDTGALMSLYQEHPNEFLVQVDNMLLAKKKIRRDFVDQLISERRKARESKDYKRSDEIRDQLVNLGIAIQDTPQGTFWEVAK